MEKNRILELAPDVLGRRKITLILHEIYPDRSQWNRNGITYLEQYTRDNADSVKGMPLCAEFLDSDKDIPYGHGLTGQEGNLSLFEDSVQVGSCEGWSIEDIEINGKLHRCLCATGYINENRYPNFVKWLEKQIDSRNPVYGSVEFVGTKDNDGEIIYDGGWKEKGRVPAVYDYIGFSIISAAPADDTALVTAFEMAKNEFDSIFEEKRNISENTEFDDVFAESCTFTQDHTDNVFGGVGTFGVIRQQEKPLSKMEYDSLIAAGLQEQEQEQEKALDFDNIFA